MAIDQVIAGGLPPKMGSTKDYNTPAGKGLGVGKRVERYPEAFRRMAVEWMRNCTNVSALARELEIDRTVLYHWQRLAGHLRSNVEELIERYYNQKRLRSALGYRSSEGSNKTRNEKARLPQLVLQ